jgi:FAD/FMN-containing dehydrogenase
MKIRSSSIESTTIRFGSLEEFFALSREHDPKNEYSAAWVDCLSKNGRGALVVASHAIGSELKVETVAKRQIPITPRWSMINRLTLRAFNEAVWRTYADRSGHYGDYSPILFPLDGILNWNRIYGRKGFQQYQCVIPEAAAEPAMRELLAAIAKAGQGSCLAVLKRCGDIASPGLMSFPMKGTSLALDFPQSPRLETILFPRLDAIVRESGGRLYPAKDAHMHGFDFRRTYPAWEKVEALRDPALNSRFWQRVTK